MKELVILRTLRTGALPNGEGAFVDIETNEGPRQFRFTAEDAERLIAALHEARNQLHAERTKSGKPPLANSRTPQRWETAIDPVEQQAVLRTHFTDGTTEETHIPRAEIARIARSLEEALKRFEGGAEMRQ
jgi:hypothetical protein